MLIIQDIHQVAGRSELPFEESYRDTLLLALRGDTQLLFFGWSPHGGGEGYEAMTLTSVADLEALDRYQERLRYGDLSTWWSSVEAMRYALDSTLHITADGAAANALGPVNGDPVAGAGGLFRLDSGVANGDQDEIGRAITRELATSSAESVCRLIACWSPFFGALGGSALHVFFRVGDHAKLAAALEADDPAARWSGTADPNHFIGGGPTRHRLFRSTGWSPLR